MSVYLTRRESTKNVARFYRMFIAPNLWGEWCLFREWGRIGAGGQVRHDVFDNAGQALLGMQTLTQVKLKRGYTASSTAGYSFNL